MSTLQLSQLAAAAPREEIYLFVSLGLLGLAIVLLLLELFVPSGGVLAVMTGVSAVASIASMFTYDVDWGGIYLAVMCAGSPIVVLLVVKLWSKTPLANRMILKEDADGPRRPSRDEHRAGDNPAVGRSGVVATASARQFAELVGHEGTTLTTLRPIGFVRVNGLRLDAVAENGVIEVGVAVIVIDSIDGQLRVRECDAQRTAE